MLPHLHWSLSGLGHANLQTSLNASCLLNSGVAFCSQVWPRGVLSQGGGKNASAKSAGAVVEASTSDLPIPVTG